MMPTRQLVALLGVLFGVALGGSPDNRGTEFVIGFMQNYAEYNDVELYITTGKQGSVSVEVSAPEYTRYVNLDEKFTVTIGYVHILYISNKIRAYGTELNSKGILVTASDDIVVYGTNMEVYSNDAFLGFPIDVLGMEYYTVSHHPTTKECEFMVIGVEDDTDVTIRLGQHSSIEVRYDRRNYYKNDVITLNMDRFDTFQAQTYGDLSGSYITSNKKITVMSGNRRTSVLPGTSRDHLVDQMMPVDTWGKRFAIVPTPERTTGDNVRFVGSEDGTSVSVTCSGGWSKTFTVNSRSFSLQVTPSDENCYVESTKAIMVVLIVVSQVGWGEPADPAMITIPPIEQYAADYTFSTPKYSLGEYKNFFMFIVKKTEASGLKLNGAAMQTYNVRDIPNTEYVGGYTVATPGTHTVRHDSPISVFGAFMYGTADCETYGLPLGMRMSPINRPCVPTAMVVGDFIDNDCDGLIDEELCTPENQGADDDGDGVAEEDCATPSPIDGGWTDWSTWTSCSASCRAHNVASASGTKTKTRTCSNPAAKYNGKDCAGAAAETIACTTTTICPTDGGWGSWGAWAGCSVSCGSGTWTRSRSCNNPSPQNGGSNCPSSSTDSTTCNTGISCPIDGGFSSWSSWGSCTVTCGGGTEARTRSCTNPSAQHGGAACSGSTSESQSCNTGNCPIDGGWASWSTWSSCPVTCGSGAISRSRTCTNPSVQYNGADCVGNAAETSYCVLGSCPIDGAFSDWSLWTSCTLTCGGGTTGRSRSCTNPTPQHGGADCTGDTSESQSCQTHNCPIDGNWATWTAWSACGITCGYSTQTRSRTCTNPAAQYLGADCVGDADESQSCYAGILCPIDGGFTTWTAWDSCTVTCATGTQDRERSCTNPTPQHLGADCVGHLTEQQNCNTHNCPIDGGWTDWTSWSGCSSTCGPGLITRDRTCTNPLPQYLGVGCFGATQESYACNGTCTQHGNWGDWGSWTSCTKTCDTGRQGRVRLCDDPAPTPDGNPCFGNAFQIGVCNTASCSGGNGTGSGSSLESAYVNKCPNGYFTCKSGKITCIKTVFKCDCASDCGDGSDESDNWATCSNQMGKMCGNTASALNYSLTLLMGYILIMGIKRFLVT